MQLHHLSSTHRPLREGPIARALERRVSLVASETFLAGALGSVMISLLLRLRGETDEALFVGRWVPVFLLFGVYTKLVRVMGTDRATSEPQKPILSSQEE